MSTSLKTSEPGKIAHKTGSKISVQRIQRSKEICPRALNVAIMSFNHWVLSLMAGYFN